MYLNNGNLVIRDAAAGDAQLLCKWWNDGAIMAHAGFPRGIGTTEQEVRSKLQSSAGDKRQGRLILEIDAIPVGEMSYRATAEHTAEIGIKICDSSAQNKGAGTRFLTLLIRHLFEELGYLRIILDTNLKNTRAQHVYETIGFRQTAVHYNSWKDQLGVWQSSIDYELAAEGWVNHF
ncbi:GNAT family protein [Paenibacillus sp. MMS20-IR301]|uniref:GNAT family N-acetyltransferase n=1 Tax=Paenibacillus sp. MMS20-IR301 TaxID=2895946 RepID=UPI0028ED58B7|nr:GNAT family protein [Paenibacillus sp. MMS20-IR301]WNS44687.1 GNAT family protein [Paenibacillus sp. MMS20-IR301]